MFTSDPVISAELIVAVPSAVNLNVELLIKLALPVAEALIKKVSVNSASCDIVKSAILPPSTKTDDPVICPLLRNIKLPLELLITDSPKSNPPITPPSNSTFDPVICPLLFNNRLLLEDDIAVGVNEKPPIKPDPVAIIFVAVISPLISASDAVI